MTLETNRPRNFRKHFTMILLQKKILISWQDLTLNGK